MRRIIDIIIEDGADALVPVGATGEFPYLLHEERKRVIDITVDQANGRVPVIAGTGALSTKEARMFTQYAKDVGCAGVLLSHPLMVRANDHETYHHFETIATKVDIPIILYNNPGFGASISPSVVARLAENFDNVVGYKEDDFFSLRYSDIIWRVTGEDRRLHWQPIRLPRLPRTGGDGCPHRRVPGLPPHNARPQERVGEEGHEEGPLLPRADREDVQHHRHQLRHRELLGQIQGDLEAQGSRHGAGCKGPMHPCDAGAAREGGAGVHEARHREDLVQEARRQVRGTFPYSLTPLFRRSYMVDVKILKEKVKGEVDAILPRLVEMSDWIGKHPELGSEEVESSKLLAAELKKHGFKVEMGVQGMPTAFKAVMKGKGKGPTIAFLCEYDALPGIGHGCGHNIIGTSGLGAGIAVSKLMKDMPGELWVVGTPAEEGHGPSSSAKKKMAEAGFFKGVDAVMMIHPMGNSKMTVATGFLAITGINIVFSGRTAHAAADPYNGLNALNAAVLCFMAIHANRQQLEAWTPTPSSTAS